MKKVLFFILLFYATKTFSQIDETFANKGFAEFNIGYANAEILGIQEDADGKIVSVSRSDWFTNNYGEFIISRFLPDGREDSTFAVYGHLRIPKVNINHQNPIIKIDHKNRYIVASGEYNGYLAVLRITYDGKIDSTFGQNGITIISIRDSEDYNGNNSAKDLFIFPDNSIGLTYKNSYEQFWPPIDIQSIGVIKIKENGQLDNDFSEDGIIQHPIKKSILYSDMYFADVASSFDESGNAYLFERTVLDSQNIRSIVKILPDGNRDVSFGNNGKIELKFDDEQLKSTGFIELKVDPSGAIYLSDYYLITKINPSGHIDSNWADLGILRKESEEYLQFQIIEDGLILIGYKELEYATKYQSIVRWYDQNGQLTIKGTDDEALQNLGLLFLSGHQNKEGSIFIGGYQSTQGDYNHEMTLTKITSAGYIDTFFAHQGTGRYRPIGNSSSIQNWFTLPDGSIIVSGQASVGLDDVGFIAKHLHDSQYDTTFGKNGLIYEPFSPDVKFYNVINKLDDLSFITIIRQESETDSYRRIYRLFTSDGSIDSNWANGVGYLELLEKRVYNNYQVTENQYIRLSYYDSISSRYAIDEFLSDGKKNTAFGNNGTLVLNINQLENIELSSIKYVQDKKYVYLRNRTNNERYIQQYDNNENINQNFGTNGAIVTGQSSFYLNSKNEIYVLQHYEGSRDISIKKYTAHGKQINEYGINGMYANVDYPDFSFRSFISGLHLMDDDNLLLKFESIVDGNEKYYFMHILPDGTPNFSFGNNGLIKISIPGSNQTNFSSFIDPVTKLWKIIGTSNVRRNTSYFMTRLNDLGKYTSTNEKSIYIQSPIKIYPNPSNNLVNISLNNNSIQRIELININGQLIKEWNFRLTEMNGSQISLNISEQLPVGTYLFRVYDGESFYFGKWMKK